VRPKPWVFVLLDLMGVAMVAYLIKYLSYESLKKKQIWSPRVGKIFLKKSIKFLIKARLIFTTILFVIAILWLIFLHSAKVRKIYCQFRSFLKFLKIQTNCEPKAPIVTLSQTEVSQFIGNIVV